MSSELEVDIRSSREEGASREIPRAGDFVTASTAGADAVAEARAANAAAFSAHADACPVGIAVVSGETLEVSYANAAFRCFARAESGLVIGRSFMDAFPLFGDQDVRRQLTLALCDSATPRVEIGVDVPGPESGAEAVTRHLTVTLSQLGNVSYHASAMPPSAVLVQVRNSAAGDDQLQDPDDPIAAGDPGPRNAHSAANDELLEVNRRLVLAALREQDLKERAEAANATKSMFLATMSHELRTPLNAIIGYASLLDDQIWGPIVDEQHQHLERLKTSARHLLALINDILTLARVDAAKECAQIEHFDATMLLDEVIALTMPLAIAKGLRLSADMGDAFALDTDRGKLVQILVNLVSNAIKFTNQGEVVLGAFAGETEADFYVRDTGIGISPVNLDHVFDMFWQVDQDLTRRVGGTGLGLNVSRRLALLLGGRLTAESAEGRGSRFTLYLPLHFSASAAPTS